MALHARAAALADPADYWTKLDVQRKATDATAASIESRGIPFVVAVNSFDGRQDRTEPEVREALDLDPRVPILLGDLRLRTAGRDVPIALMDLLLSEQQPVASR